MVASSSGMPSPVSAEMRTGRRLLAGPAATLPRASRGRRRESRSALFQTSMIRFVSSGSMPELPQNDGDVARLRLRLAMGHVADMEKHVGLDHVLQGGAEGRHEHGRQIGDEPDGVRQDGLLPVRKIDGAGGGIEGRKQHVLGQDVGLRSCG